MSIDTTDLTFGALGVPSALTAALADLGITTPTPIQAATLPDSLAGRDVLGRGRTGSGKTYAFLLPIVARLAAAPTRRSPGRPRALILAPTRELATQIDTALAPLAATAGLNSLTIFGGVGQNPQVQGLRRGVDVVVACPGRLEDLMGQGHVSLDSVEITVLDEADHMADLGFLPGVRRIMDKTPATGQRMLFSATLDGAINVIVKRFLTSPRTHEADSAQSPVSTMAHHVLHVTSDAHLAVILDLAAAPGRKVVFTRTKHRAKKLAKQLNSSGVPAVELHGNLSQGARTRNMDDFHSGRAQTLVATDIAARGIHVDDVALVIHADPPVEHKAYLHRSGRTARAGADGTVVTMMLDDQVRDVRDLTRKAGIKPTTTRVAVGHPLLVELAPGERSYAAGLVREAVPTVGGGARRQGGSGSSRGTGARDGAGQGRAGGGRAGGGRAGGGRGAGRSGGSAAAGGSGSSAASGSGRRGGSGSSGSSAGARAGAGGNGGRGRQGGSATVYSTSSGGGAAAFSAGTRAGSRRRAG
ncbi:DEAD/DEAH box helicase [Intrasporangium calvum]|uniref:DEAD/DEAH box helicase domain protein n=1 Tax=Intrasporangium calvum (strain ATCC 23552 / DSM 43043 / JCM 3097 / NBRC 12989 / NCIMB 10167 / NRRL B-3866 / 7 KIP) TaxID=710696 RepID=E6S645_INTC7|nr:DEAD/DEAH box helicase [Intrasporangium calvum]ADU46785.1 DEAD/DEAH box helicase domain protein [Intrasporangium calvum DSM 43043]